MKKGKQDPIDFRLEPEKRLCNIFDAYSLVLWPNEDSDKQTGIVKDNCAEENIR